MAASDDAEDNSFVLGKRSGPQHEMNDRASMFKPDPVRYTENPRMICRIWHGYTTHEKAGAYERVVRTIVIPGIEERSIPGFLSIDLIKRQLEHEVEFMTLMWFDSQEAIVAFVGEDVTISHVPLEAREVLERFDDRSQHYAVIDRREQ
jgi:heme-degrading monooxygenase HmoA